MWQRGWWRYDRNKDNVDYNNDNEKEEDNNDNNLNEKEDYDDDKDDNSSFDKSRDPLSKSWMCLTIHHITFQTTLNLLTL